MTIDEIKKWMLESSGFPVTQANAEYLERFQAIAFQAGAASRDAEVARLEQENDQLRAQINRLCEALGKHLNELMNIAVSNGANSVSMPDDYVSTALLLSETPEQSLAEYRNKAIEECAVKADALANCEENTDGYRNGAAWCAEAIRAMKEQL